MKKMQSIKFWAAVCAVLLAASCLVTMIFIGGAVDAASTLGTQNVYVCNIEADTMTNIPPYASKGYTGGFGSRDSDGRVWVDKSVQANAESNAFDVTLSALAQEYTYSEQTIETILEQNAADVLFILDFSSSMVGTSSNMKDDQGNTVGYRLKVLSDSLNAAMKEISEVNPYNRIMAVGFDKGSYDFLPLGTYSAGTNGNYVEFANNTISTASGVKFVGVDNNGVSHDGGKEDNVSFSLKSGSGTHMQIGITYGCDKLLQTMSEGYGEGKRLPFVMVMTDGESNYSNNNWAGVNLESNNGTSIQREANSTLAATYWKKRLIDAYNAKNIDNKFESDVNAVWFNIGIGLGDPGTNMNGASAVQVSMKPSFACPAASTTSNAGKIYSQILTFLENAYTHPENFIGDPLDGSSDDELRKAGIDPDQLRAYIAETAGAAETAFELNCNTAGTTQYNAIKKAGDDAANPILEAGAYQNNDKYFKYIENTYGLKHGKGSYKNNEELYKQDVAKKVNEAAEKARSQAEAAKKQELYDEEVTAVTENALKEGLKKQDNKTEEDFYNAVYGSFLSYLEDYLGYKGDTTAARQANYAENPMHYFAEYVNYADTSTKVNDSFDQLASLISAATQGTVIPITHHATSGAAADEIFITFTDPIGEGTMIKTDEDGNYIMSIELDGVTYTGRQKADAEEGVYEFYNETKDKVLYSTATISDDSVKWEINAYELPIIRFANRMMPGEESGGKIYEDPNLPPIAVKYQVVPTTEALANTTASATSYIYEHDNIAAAPAQAVFTPTLANTYYFTNTGDTEHPVYEKVTSIEDTVNKGTNANKSKTAAYVTSSSWGTGDDADDFFILLGNDARTKVVAEVSIEDDRMEDDGDIVAHTYGIDETINYTLKVKNCSTDKLEKLTYTLDVTPSGPAATDTPSALTVGTCSTTPDSKVTTGNKQTLTFTIDELAAGATQTVTVPMTPAAGTKNGTTVDAVITLTKVFDSNLAVPATDEVGEVLVSADATVYTHLDGVKTNLTGISGAPSTLYIKKEGGDYIALTKATGTATYVATSIPVGNYTIYDGNSGTPKALGAVTVTQDGDNIGNVYWKTLTLAKVWDDNNNQDGKRTDVTLTLYRAVGSGDPVKVDDYALTSADAVTGDTNKWEKSFVVLAKDASGNDYTFTLDELEANVPQGYDKSVSGLTVTNTHTPETQSITITKVWDDAEFIGQAGYNRPTSISVELIAKVNNVKDDLLSQTITMSDDYAYAANPSEWRYIFLSRPVYKDGQPIEYTVSEETPDGYASAVDGFKITNTPKDISDVYNPHSLPVSKLDKNTNEALQGAVFTATATDIQAVTGTTNASGVATLTFLKPGTYTVSETTPPTGYKTNSETFTITVNRSLESIKYDSASMKWVRTYHLFIDTTASSTLTDGKLVVKDEPTTCSVTLKKVWNDNSDQDGKRPESVVLSLYKTVNDVTTWVQDVTIDEPATFSNEWSKTITDLPAYESGYAVTYTADEKAANVPENYEKESASGLVVTNKHTPETTSVMLTKKWDDNHNQDGLRTANVTLTLYKQIEGGTKTKVADYTYTDTGDDWVKTIENLPVFESGKPITYTADETTVPSGYEKEANGLVVTNKHTPATVSVTLKKVWDDNNNQDGKRPDSIKLMLLKKVGTKTSIEDEYEILAGVGNEWTKTIDNLPKYEGGVEIEYLADEDNNKMPSGYSKLSASGLVVTNQHVPEVQTISGKKTWDDADFVGKTGYTRPSITVNLIATVGSAKIDALCKQTTVKATDDWEYAFYDVPVYYNSETVSYTVSEEAINGFTATVTDKNIKNTPIEKAEILKPTSFVVKKVDSLTTSGKGIQGAEFTLTDPAGLTASYITGIDGTAEIPFTVTGTYTLTEKTAPTGYQLNAANTYTVTVTKNFTKMELSSDKTKWNWHYDLAYSLASVSDGVLTVKDAPITQAKTTLTKVWDDNKNQDGIRPEKITLALYKTVNSVTSKVQDVVLEGGSTAESWTKDLENLPTYEDGYPVTYTVDEDTDQLGEDYSKKSVDNTTLTVTNFHKPGVTSVTLKKVWDDNSDQDGKRPDDVTLTLYKTVGDVTTEVQDVTFDGTGNEWTKKVDNLDKFEGGKLITYTADEKIDNVPANYEKESASGLVVTNKHTPETTSKTLTKVWDDNSDQDGKRPDDVTLTLYKTVDGTTTEVQDVTFDGSGNEWSKTIEDLPVYEGGFTITYTADEKIDNVPANYEKESASGLVVTNKHTPAKTPVTLKKVWDDNSDQDGIRPDDITLTLYKTVDGTTTEVQDVTFDGSGNEWSKTIEDLPVYESGFEITYTADEKTDNIPTDYTKEADGLTVTNTHAPAVTSVTLTKIWVDESNADTIRPADITLTLYKTVDGTTTEVQDVTFDGTGNEWTKTIDNLPVRENGNDIAYTVDEEAANVPEGYTKSAKELTVTNTHEVSRKVTVTVTGGTASNGTTSVIYGEDFNTIFTPEEGYVILSVTIDGKEVKITDDLTYGFENITEDHEIIVVFAEDKNGNGVPDIFDVTVTYTVENGTWEDGTTDNKTVTFPTKELKGGEWVPSNPTLEDTIPTGMKPAEHYENIASWNEEIGGDTPVTEDVTYTYTFGEKITHDITVNVTNGTSNVEDGKVTVIDGEEKTVTFTPNEGYAIESVVIDGKVVKPNDNNEYIFNDITEDHEITVIFGKDENGNGIPDNHEANVTYQVANGTWEDGNVEDIVVPFIIEEMNDEGVWVPTGATLGESIPVGMIPDEFHTEVSSWNTEIGASTPVTGNATYLYTFGDDKVHTFVVEVKNGTTDPGETTFPVPHKQDQTIKLIPNDGYVLDSIIVDGKTVDLPNDSTLVFPAVTEDHTIQVLFEEDLNYDGIADKYQATVTIVLDENAGQAGGAGVYMKGDTATVTAKPNDGYHFIGWKLGDEIISTDAEFSLRVTEDIELEPIFEKIPETTTTQAPTTSHIAPTSPKPSPSTGEAFPIAAMCVAMMSAAVLVLGNKRNKR